MTRNSAYWWLRSARRFLTAKELAALCGFPVPVALAQAGRVPCDPCADDYDCGQIGNCMHVGSVGMVLAVTLACLRVV